MRSPRGWAPKAPHSTAPASGEILAEEGFGRLLRHPAEAASTAVATPGRDTRLPKTAALDFATWPGRCDTSKAGLLLLVPDLIALDLPDLAPVSGLVRS